MKNALFMLTLSALVLALLSGCSYEKTYYHKNGKVKHVRAKTREPWHRAGESGYSKSARRTIRNWDRNFR